MPARFLLLALLWICIPASVCGQTILVLPFDNSSSESRYDWIAEGLAHRTRQLLSGEGRLVLSYSDSSVALDRLGLPTSPEAAGRFTRATMLKIAAELDADFVVFGKFSSAPGKVALATQVLRVTPPGLSRSFAESATDQNFLAAHARLSWEALRYIAADLTISQQDFLRRFAPPRLSAFEQYMRGLLAADPASRLQFLLAAARAEPGWTDPAFELGLQFYGRRDCSTALIWLSRVPPAHDRGIEAAFYSGVCHLLGNDPARAESSFASIQPIARLPEVLNNLGVARARLARIAEAAAMFRAAAQLDATDPDFPFNLGLLAYRTGDVAAALAPLRDALARNSDDAAARALLAAALDRSGQNAEATSIREASSKPLPAINSDSLARLDRIKLQLDLSPLHPGFNDRNPPSAPPASNPNDSRRPPGDRTLGDRPLGDHQ